MEMRAAAELQMQSRRDRLRIQYHQQSHHFDDQQQQQQQQQTRHHRNEGKSSGGIGSLLYDPITTTASAVHFSRNEEELLDFSSPNDPRWKLLGFSSQNSYPVDPSPSSLPHLSTYSPNGIRYDHRHHHQHHLDGSMMQITNPDFTQQQQLYHHSTNSTNENGGCEDELLLLPSSAYGGGEIDANAYGRDYMEFPSAVNLGKSDSYRLRSTTDVTVAVAAAAADIASNHHHGSGGALALSLSSNPWSGGKATNATNNVTVYHQDPKPSTSNCGRAAAAAAPLGPFTGYATVLKNSKFLKPAQTVLDEFCALVSSRNNHIQQKTSDDDNKGNRWRDQEDIIIPDTENVGPSSSVGLPSKSSRLYGSSSRIRGGEAAAPAEVGSSSSESCLPDYQQKKATLLFMHEEVCKRYRQYHQHMESVVSSFESVAGLSAATPYVSVAIKAISKHFRSLKNAITNQLRHVRLALGEDLASSPDTGVASTTKGDATMSRLKFMEKNFQKHKPGGVDAGFLEPQQHIWRPQRGLPERSVAILRAWLFDHFLHPYPTDTDKHMLATQTGLSRNQVSNWFINARVRIWKPMVEEIHMLENKGSSEGKQNESSTRLSVDVMPDKQVETSGAMGTSEGGIDGHVEQYWNQEKRARVECDIPESVSGELIGFEPYEHHGLENVGGMGAVSLTLGLRNNVDSSQQFQQQEHRLRQHFGGHMIHDFVG